jgi:phosphatidylserine/phosphatidylglycerophosphate/cardiolipin synthase-like enzyme
MKKQAAHESNSYVVGVGIASLAAAALLIRDGDVGGSTITILEEWATVDGSLSELKVAVRGRLDRPRSTDAPTRPGPLEHSLRGRCTRRAVCRQRCALPYRPSRLTREREARTCRS